MNKIKQWYMRNYTEITWFLIGWLTLCGFQDLAKGDYIGTLISWGLVWLNYSLFKK